ncbi:MULTISPECIES: hypothetical protein [unclassified Tychonema]|nr:MULTISPECIES: hypothetical protein [unclassified Tychonema]
MNLVDPLVNCRDRTAVVKSGNQLKKHAIYSAAKLRGAIASRI